MYNLIVDGKTVYSDSDFIRCWNRLVDDPTSSICGRTYGKSKGTVNQLTWDGEKYYYKIVPFEIKEE